MAEPVRLQRFLASGGVAARRKAEEMITAGRVRVNGVVVKVLGTKVNPEEDSVTVDGEPVMAHEFFYVLFNKPKACITAVSDDRGRPTVMDYLPNLPVPVKPVGRLDFYSEGVLLLTNDGELASRLLAPASHVAKTYHVKVHGQVTKEDLAVLRGGVQLDDGSTTLPADVTILPGESKYTWLGITIHEGKHRQIHRMLEARGYRVDKLQRVAFANLTFHNLRIGDARELSQAELNELRTLVGLDHSTVARGAWRVDRENTDIQRRAKTKARLEAEEAANAPPVYESDDDDALDDDEAFARDEHDDDGEGAERGAGREEATARREPTRPGGPRGPAARETRGAGAGERGPRGVSGDRSPAAGGARSFGGERDARGARGARGPVRGGERDARGARGLARGFGGGERDTRGGRGPGAGPARGFGGERDARGGRGQGAGPARSFGGERDARGGRGPGAGPARSFGGERDTRGGRGPGAGPARGFGGERGGRSAGPSRGGERDARGGRSAGPSRGGERDARGGRGGAGPARSFGGDRDARGGRAPARSFGGSGGRGTGGDRGARGAGGAVGRDADAREREERAPGPRGPTYGTTRPGGARTGAGRGARGARANASTGRGAGSERGAAPSRGARSAGRPPGKRGGSR